VGGQRSERKKWIHLFEDVTAILFCVGLSSFDQTLREDNTTNRLLEALNLFNDTYTSPWFQSSAKILFLNKSDLFKAKLKTGKSISDIFPDFSGDSDFESSLEFIEEKFIVIQENSPMGIMKNIYCHVTNATDTENVKFVFQSVRDFVFKENIQRAGIF